MSREHQCQVLLETSVDCSTGRRLSERRVFNPMGGSTVSAAYGYEYGYGYEYEFQRTYKVQAGRYVCMWTVARTLVQISNRHPTHLQPCE